MNKDYYKILNVDKYSSSDDIKKSYRKLALLYHPDKNLDDVQSEEKFKEISEAYDVLSNPIKKQEYDYKYGYTMNIETILNNFDNDIYNFAINNGTDIQTVTYLSPLDLLSEYKINITYNRNIICRDCNGVGGFNIKPCTMCKGNGYIKVPFNNNITVNCQLCNGTGTQATDICPTCKGKKLIKEEKKIVITLKPELPVSFFKYGYITKEIKSLGNEGFHRIGNLIIIIRINNTENIKLLNNGDIIINKDVTLVDMLIDTEIKLTDKIVFNTQNRTNNNSLYLYEKGIYNNLTNKNNDIIINLITNIPKQTDLTNIQIDKIKEVFK